MKYKVGDIVKIRKDLINGKDYYMKNHYYSTIFINEMDKYLGLYTNIISVDKRGYKVGIDSYYSYTWTDEMFEDTTSESIHITRKDNKVIAVYKNDDTVINRAEARCHPNDEFDFEYGAKLAMERLLNETEIKSSDNDFEVGDMIHIIDTGLVYDTYIDWIKKYCHNPNDLAHYVYGRMPSNTVTGYRIIAKGKNISLNETLCAVQSMTDDSVYIIDEKGIEKI